MEPRQLLATFLVSNTADSGPGSLRQAILDSNAHPNTNGIDDVINFDVLVRQFVQFGAGSNPNGITAGPDGNMWVALNGAIGRFKPAAPQDVMGTPTLFPMPDKGKVVGITSAPDGNLWFTDQNPTAPAIGRITPAGAITLFPLANGAVPNRITAGADGNLYFSDDGVNPGVGRISTAGVLNGFFSEPGNPNGLTLGSDSNVWAAVGGNNPRLVRITPGGATTDFTIFTGTTIAGQVSNPLDITTGPNGDLFFTDNGSIPEIGRLTTDGGFAFIDLPGHSNPRGITAGPDGNIYFVQDLDNGDGTISHAVSRLTPGGQITNFTYGTGSTPRELALGPDNKLYLTEPQSNNVGVFDPIKLGTISPLSPLPEITDAVDIDGFSQSGSVQNDSLHDLKLHPSAVQIPLQTDTQFLVVTIDGSLAGAGANGLVFHGMGNHSTSNSRAEGLIIQNFSGNGVLVEDDSPPPTSTAAQGVTIFGSFIQDNAQAGIQINSSNNTVGGNSPAFRTEILRNNVGVLIQGAGGTGNRIMGSFIRDNTHEGVLITSSNNTVGDLAVEGGLNVISGNERGVRITNIGALPGSVAQGNEVLVNRIGTDIFGYGADGNIFEGVLIENSPGNRVGNTAQNAVIMASGTDGVHITGPLSAGNRILGDFIGFNVGEGGQTVFAGNMDGVRIESPNNVVGGVQTGDRNVISTNKHAGVVISGAAASGNVLLGNYVGLNPGGGSDFGNTLDGVIIDNATDNVIGGTDPAARNDIAGNNWGVTINGAGATGNRILGDFIGTGADGITDIGNALDGVRIVGSPGNTIGGTDPGSGNVISGNNRGVTISGATAVRNAVQGNFIGTDLTATINVGNEIDGVLVTDGASNNPIGGTQAGAGNVVAFNSGAGVLIASGTGDSILSNRIFKNVKLGIDLVGDGIPVPNDPLDTDTGSNDLQNYPVLTNVSTGTNLTDIQGTLNSTPNSTFRIEFFANDAADPTGFGQGQFVIGSTVVNTDSLGNAAFAVDLAAPVTPGQFISSTATNVANGDTSEFSRSVPNIATTVQFAVASAKVPEGAGSATITVTRTGAIGGTVSVAFATADGTAHAGNEYTPVSGVLTFGPGELNKTFTVPIIENHVAEGDTTVLLNLSSPTGGAKLGTPSTEVLTILDQDNLTEQFSAASYSILEGNVGAVVTVVRTSSGGASSVDFATGGGTAVPGFNYTPVSGTLSFAAGETAKSFVVPIREDFVADGNRTVGLTLSNPVNSQLAPPSTATLTIVDNDQPGTFRFSSPTYTVGEAAGTATITVTRTGGIGGPIRVPVFAVGGTSVPGVDFTPVATVLTFNRGESSKTFTVPIINNSLIEPNHTVNLSIGTPSGGSLGTPNRAVLTIIDDDRAGAFKFANPQLFVSSVGGSAVVTVVRTGGQGGPVVVPFSTGGGTAVPGVDYTPVTGVIIFGPGETTKSVVIPILPNTRPGPDKTVGLFLGQPSSGGTLANPSAGVLTILNNAPNLNGPVVTDLRTVTNGAGITGVVLSFSKPLNPATAQNVANYGSQIVNAGPDGKVGTIDDISVPIRAAVYNPATDSVILVPAAALPLNTINEVTVNQGTGGGGVADTAGNLLDGNANGLPGGAYVAQFGLGTNLHYSDADGDIVFLQITGGGLVEARLAASGDAQQLRVVNPVVGRSVLFGHLDKLGGGTSPIPSVVGTQGIPVLFLTPPFTVGTISTAPTPLITASLARSLSAKRKP
jgi:streptogramin lyase